MLIETHTLTLAMMNHLVFLCLSKNFFMAALAQNGVNLNECRQTSCGRHGPDVRFPFRIKDRQPAYCGYPGFDLSCTDGKKTLLELPNSVKLFVQDINYASQMIHVSDAEGCLPRRLLNFNISSSSSPFQLFDDGINSRSYTVIACTLTTSLSGYWHISCLTAPDYQVYALPSDFTITDPSLQSCTKMYDLPSVPRNADFSENTFYLSWSKPSCEFCLAVDKYCRLKNTSNETECYDLPKQTKGSLKKKVITGTVLGLFFLIVAVIAAHYTYVRDKTEKEYQTKIKKFLDDYKAFKPTRYSFADLKRITNYFKHELGQGAYGTVFKGKLSDEVMVAVKVLNESKGNGEEFINEVGTIANIHHANVVRLVGFCADGFIRALVYEYLPNDSLQKFIFSADSRNHFLGWKSLERITIGVAKGIDYLHQGCDQRILHFDIKPHNVLLDHNFNPKISDFGMAKLCSRDQSVVSMTTARGTIGYMAPEVFSRNFGNVSSKSDVYSFGMLVLEMVGGRKGVDTDSDGEQVYFPEWIYNLLERGEDLRFDIEEEEDAKIAKKLAIVGLWCIQWNPVDRPSMKFVVQMLEKEGESLNTPPNPFGSNVQSKMNKLAAGRLVHQELEAIEEAEQM